MFTVGDFARLAQVSKRQLRYYDEIDLFKPNQTDKFTGYRYYTADQMADLNRILALKELGLSLEQIQQTMTQDVSVGSLQEMLLIKKAEIESYMQAELQRIRKIENHLHAIRTTEDDTPPNVIIKEIPDTYVMSMRQTVADFEHGMAIYGQIAKWLPKRLRHKFLLCICHDDDYVETNLDLEMGVYVDNQPKKALKLPPDIVLEPRLLEGHQIMATTVVKGALDTIHDGYINITKWLGNHEYQLAGIPREIMLQFPDDLSGDELVTEIQFPIQPRNA